MYIDYKSFATEVYISLELDFLASQARSNKCLSDPRHILECCRLWTVIMTDLHQTFVSNFQTFMLQHYVKNALHSTQL